MTNIRGIRQQSFLARIAATTNRQARETHPRSRLTQAQIADLTTFADAAIVAASFALAQLLYVAVSDVQLSLDVNYSVVGLIAGFIHYVVLRA